MPALLHKTTVLSVLVLLHDIGVCLHVCSEENGDTVRFEEAVRMSCRVDKRLWWIGVDDALPTTSTYMPAP